MIRVTWAFLVWVVLAPGYGLAPATDTLCLFVFVLFLLLLLFVFFFTKRAYQPPGLSAPSPPPPLSETVGIQEELEEYAYQ